MGVREHLAAPQLVDEYGQPTIRPGWLGHSPLSRPGEPRWHGYLYGLGMMVVGVVLVVLVILPYLGLALVLLSFGELYQVYSGRPFQPWRRANEDERWDRRETGVLVVTWAVLFGVLGWFSIDVVAEQEGLTNIEFYGWMAAISVLSFVPAAALAWTFRRRRTSGPHRSRREAQRGVRHTIAAAGVVLTLPDDWQVMKGDMSASARRQREPIDGGEPGVDAAAGVPAANHAVSLMAWRGEDGLKLQIEPTEQRTPEAIVTAARPGAGPTSDVDPSVEHIDLPAGKAARVRTEDSETGQAIISTRYVLVRDGLAYDLVFASPDPPEDDWLSIAETIEFLFAEE